MDDDSTTHPDEGMIHAWLDGALDAPTAAGIAEHVRTCPACTERVAEARGLIAGASRIVASLDDDSAAARPGWAQSAPERGAAPDPGARAADQGSLWRWLHVTPARAAIAATVLVALGITFTRTRSGPDDVQMASRSGKLSAPSAMMSDSASTAVASAPAERDPLLDSAIKKNLEIAQPPRAFEAARSPAIPAPPPRADVGLAGVDTSAAARVAAAREVVTAQREQSASAADKSRVRGTVAAPAPAASGLAQSDARVVPGASSSYSDRNVASRSADAVAKQCYLLESAVPGAQWGGESLPLVVVVDSAVRATGAPASVLTASGRPTPVRARYLPGNADSLTLALQRIGYTGSIQLGPDLGGRVGLATSAPATVALEAVTVTSADARRRDSGAGAVAERKAAASPAAAPASGVAGASPAAPARVVVTRVRMRAASCPAP